MVEGDRHLSRAKRTDNGELVEGFLTKGKWYFDERKIYAILPMDLCFYPACEISEWIEIDKSTICKCTGFKDNNGKPIWENDVIQYNICYEVRKPTGIIIWNNGTWCIKWMRDEQMSDKNLRSDLHFWVTQRNIEVIGNIYDNPELLEVGG